MALDLTKRSAVQTALDLFHICLTRRVGEIDRKELCIACYCQDPSQHRHECMDWPDKNLFFGDKHRTYDNMELLDGEQIYNDYLNLVSSYDDDVKNEASKLITTDPMLTIQFLDAARLVVRKFYDDKIVDLYEAIKENFNKLFKNIKNIKTQTLKNLSISTNKL